MYFSAVHELLRWIEALPPSQRDAAVEAELGIGAADPAPPGAELIGYHPSGVDAILRALREAPVTGADVLVDLGAGLGKVLLLARMLTGARVRGIEIQPSLVERARATAGRLGVEIEIEVGDALTAPLEGTVFFLYLPFTGETMRRVLSRLSEVPHRIVVCALGVDLVAPWLRARQTDSFWLTIYDDIRTMPSE